MRKNVWLLSLVLFLGITTTNSYASDLYDILNTGKGSGINGQLTAEELNNLPAGTKVSIKNAANGKFLEVPGKEGTPSWSTFTATANTDPAAQFELLKYDNFLGFKASTGKNLQSVPAFAKGEPAWVVRAENTNFAHKDHSWEHWTVVQKTSNLCLKNQATGGLINLRGANLVRTHGNDLTPANTNLDSVNLEIHVLPNQAPTFTIPENLSNGTMVAIKCLKNNKYLAVQPNKWIAATASSKQDKNAQFTVALADKWIGFKSLSNGKFLQAVPPESNPGWVVRAEADSMTGSNSTWTHFAVDGNYIYSRSTNGYINFRNWSATDNIRTHGEQTSPPWFPAGKIPTAQFAIEVITPPAPAAAPVAPAVTTREFDTATAPAIAAKDPYDILTTGKGSGINGQLTAEELNSLPAGTKVSIKSAANGKFLEVPGKEGTPSWSTFTATTNTDPAAQFELLKYDNFLGFKASTGKNLQSVPSFAKGEPAWVVRAENTNFAHKDHSWEHWTVVQKPSNLCLKNQATGGLINLRGANLVRTHGNDLTPANTNLDSVNLEIHVLPNQAPTFTIPENLSDGTMVAIKCLKNNKYLAVQPNKWIAATASSKQDKNAQFTITLADKWIGFKSLLNGKFLQAVPPGSDPAWVIRAEADSMTGDKSIWTHFAVDGNYIYSQSTNAYVNFRNWAATDNIRTHGEQTSPPWLPAGKIPTAQFAIEVLTPAAAPAPATTAPAPAAKDVAVPVTTVTAPAATTVTTPATETKKKAVKKKARKKKVAKKKAKTKKRTKIKSKKKHAKKKVSKKGKKHKLSKSKSKAKKSKAVSKRKSKKHSKLKSKKKHVKKGRTRTGKKSKLSKSKSKKKAVSKKSKKAAAKSRQLRRKGAQAKQKVAVSKKKVTVKKERSKQQVIEKKEQSAPQQSDNE